MITVAFGNLYNACLANGMRAHLHTYDAGQAIAIYRMETGVPVFSWSSDWGEGDVSSVAAEHLLEQGLIKPADLEG